MSLYGTVRETTTITSGFYTVFEIHWNTLIYLHLFDPSNTTFVKHFICQAQNFTPSAYFDNMHIAGYCNTTSAVNAVQFKMASGNIDGTIKLYGVS